MAYRSDSQKQHQDRANRILGKSGNSTMHGDAREDAAMIRKAIHAHEANMHPGKAPTKLASGGVAKPKAKKPHTNITINVGKSDDGPKAVPVPIPASGPPRPPMGGIIPPKPPTPPMGAPPLGPMAAGGPGVAPPMGLPPGAGPMPMKPPGMKRGGSVKKRADGGRALTPEDG